MNISDKIFQTVKSLGKVVLQSRRPTVSSSADGGRIIVMGNGPSLNSTIDAHMDLLCSVPTMAVNFAANAPVFAKLRPRYYVLADPHFFSGASDANLELLWKSLRSVDWAMTLFVPASLVSKVRTILGPGTVAVEGFNAVGAEGFDCISDVLYRLNLAMPRPRNVLIPAIMLAIAVGFREIDIVGADHSWMKTLSVSDDNEVVSVKEHFYTDGAEEKARVRHEYKGYRLHMIVESFAVAFRSYIDIARYASKRGVKIFNCTPGSFIDAFPRCELH